jgi:SAM-dependent methyltransferase
LNYDAEFLFYLEHMNRQFSGWDFSYVEKAGRMQEEPLDWSYGSLALSYMNKAGAVLDMGTGGGELLSMLGPFPQDTCATEAYAPNVPIAKAHLEPLGVQVEQVFTDDELPFADGRFDLVINRHESYSVREVRRILRDSGIFLTQQVGGTDCREINERLGVPLNDEFQHWNLDYAVKELEENGFKIIEKREQAPMQRFYDIGALVYYLKVIEWQAAGFRIEEHMEALYGIYEDIKNRGFWETTQQRFLIVAAPQ